MARKAKDAGLPLRLQNERRRTLRWWADAGYQIQEIVDAFEGLTRYKVGQILKQDASKRPHEDAPEI